MPTAPAKAAFYGADIGYLRKYDISDKIFQQGPDDARVLTLFNEMGAVKTVNDPEFTLNDQDIEPSIVQVDSVDGGTKRIILKSGQGASVEVYSVLRKSLTVAVYVTAVNPDGDNADEIVCNAVAGISASDYLSLGAPAEKEWADRPNPKSWTPAGRTDYVQSTAVAWGSSNLAKTMAAWVPGLVVENNRKSAYAYLKRTIERGIINGSKQKITGPPLVYMAGGMLEQIKNNDGIVTDFASSKVTYDALVAADSDRTYAKSDVSLVVTSAGVIGLLTSLFSKQQRYVNQQATSFGIRFREFDIGSRTYRCVPSHHFQGPLAESALVIDTKMAELVTTQIEGSRQWMMLETNAQDPGTDGTINLLRCRWGVRLNNTPGHAIWTNLHELAS